MICMPVTRITTEAALGKSERAVRVIDKIMAGGQRNE
jgi:hypothetical protein